MRTYKIYKGKNIIRFVLPVVFVVLLFSCNKISEPNIDDFGYEYYPTTVGDYRVYYTKTIRYNLDGSVDTLTYLVKEIAEDSVLFSDGTTKIILGRYSANIGSNTWQKDSLWAVSKNKVNVVVSESNVNFIKLVFPIEEDKEWDGNALNGRSVELYKMVDVGKAYTYDTIAYNQTLTVVHKDLIDPAKITEDDYRIEVFAAKIGLIYRLKIKLNYCSNCVENGKIDDGFIFEQKLIEIGKE